MKTFNKITRTLSEHKIGEDGICFLLEKRILEYLKRKKEIKEGISDSLRKNLIKVSINFNSLSKGTYYFWSEIDSLLDAKGKREILEKIKTPTSIAHAHLKII